MCFIDEDHKFISSTIGVLKSQFGNFKIRAVQYFDVTDPHIIHIDDDLGHLAITTEGVLARDRMVYAKCAAAGVPVAAVIGGGYQRDIDALVDVHMQLFRSAGVV